jgi:exonuclease III
MIKKFSDLKYEDVLHKLYKESEQDRFTYIATNKKSSYQLDYLFLPKQIKIISAKTGDENEIFNQQSRLSDHLPIIAEIEI